MSVILESRSAGRRLLGAAAVLAACVAAGFAVSRAPSSGSTTSLALVGAAAMLSIWILFVARDENLGRWLLAATVLQGSFVFDVGVFILPAYAVAALVALRVYRHETRIRTRPDRVLSWMLALTALSIPVALVLRSRFPLVDAGFRYSTARPFIQFGVFCLFIVLYRAVVATSATPTLYRRALRFFLLVGSVVAGYAIYQQIAYRAGLPLVTLPGPSGLSREIVTVLPTGGSTFRSNATFVEPLDLGRYLIATSLVALSLLMGRTGIGISRRALSAILGLQLVALVLTFSSSAYLGLVAGIITAVVVAKRRLRLLVGMIVVVILIGFSASAVSVWLLQGDVSTRAVIASRAEHAVQIETAGGDNPAYAGFRRTGYWLASIQMAARRPLTGVGIGNFGAAAVALNPGLVPEAGSYGAFSGWLGEFGIPGLLVFLTLVVVLLRTLRQAYAADSDGRPELLGFLAGSVGLVVQYLFSGYWRLDPFTWAFFGLAMAGVVAHDRQPARSDVREPL